MIVLRSRLQGEDIIQHTKQKYHVLCSSMQEEDVLDNTNAKCRLCTS